MNTARCILFGVALALGAIALLRERLDTWAFAAIGCAVVAFMMPA